MAMDGDANFNLDTSLMEVESDNGKYWIFYLRLQNPWNEWFSRVDLTVARFVYIGHHGAIVWKHCLFLSTESEDMELVWSSMTFGDLGIIVDSDGASEGAEDLLLGSPLPSTSAEITAYLGPASISMCREVAKTPRPPLAAANHLAGCWPSNQAGDQARGLHTWEGKQKHFEKSQVSTVEIRWLAKENVMKLLISWIYPPGSLISALPCGSLISKRKIALTTNKTRCQVLYALSVNTCKTVAAAMISWIKKQSLILLTKSY